MCGIFLINKQNNLSTSDKKKSQQSIKILFNRGPDYNNIFFRKNIAIGHTRLSILDLSDRSNQPFYDNDLDCYLAINGEIINYRELAKKYNINSTGSDCRIVFELFKKYGVKNIINELEGMFAGIFVNAKDNTSIIFRDRFGIKPLYYSKLEDSFIASSEINAILPFLDRRIPNNKIVRDFIIDGNIDHSKETFFKNIFQVTSGCLIEIDIKKNKIHEERWYKENFEIENSRENYHESKSKLNDILKKIVLQNYISDVPVAVNLSEGIDSTLLASISESIGKNPLSYSLKFGLQNLDEYYKLQPVNLNRKFINFDTDDFFTHLKEVIISQSQPFTGMFTVAYSLLYKISREKGFKVYLDGNGLDEIFLGYDKYLNFNNLKSHQSLCGDSYKIYDFYHKNLVNTASAMSLNDILSKFPKNLDSARKLSLADLFYLKVPRVLRFNDHISMNHSCELRVPFLDHRLLNFSLSLPKNFLINNEENLGKFIIRDILGEYTKPEFAFSKKRYIQTRQTDMIFNELSNLVRNTLLNERFLEKNIVEPLKFKNHFENINKNEINNSFYIWRLLSYEWWHQQFIE